MEPIRACIDSVCKVIDYWIDEAGLTLAEITFILSQVDLQYMDEQEDWEVEGDEDEEGEEETEV